MAFAAPFLICDPPDHAENITHYLVQIDGGVIEDTPAPLHYDLANVTNGYHDVLVQAKNIWGSESPAAPFNFIKEVPSATAGITISTD